MKLPNFLPHKDFSDNLCSTETSRTLLKAYLALPVPTVPV